jgi:hypothetical protein
MAIQTPSSLSVPPVATPADAGRSSGSESDADSGFSFHDLLSIVNPLQHLPVISTLYRRLTGDTIKPFERIAGDTLYGGWMGLASSVANLVFEKETGKDFGDTVLAWLSGGSDSRPATQLAAAGSPASQTTATQPQAPAAPVTAQTKLPTTASASSVTQMLPGVSDPGVAALSASMAASHVDSELAQRAAYAYRRSMAASHAPLNLAPAM